MRVAATSVKLIESTGQRRNSLRSIATKYLHHRAHPHRKAGSLEATFNGAFYMLQQGPGVPDQLVKCGFHTMTCRLS